MNVVETNMKFNVVIGNPPFSKGNSGKGGTSIYHLFAAKAMRTAPVVALVTPGSFGEGRRYAEMRNMMDERGVDITSIPLNVFSNANIIKPCYSIIGNGSTKTVNDFFTTPAKELFAKIIQDSLSFDGLKSGKSEVSTSGLGNISSTKTETHRYMFIDRVKKEGPIYAYCNDKLNLSINGPKMVFAQRGGLKPKMFFDDQATSYSQNVISISVDSETQYSNLKTLLQTNIYKFLLLELAGGKITTKAGFPSPFTVGKIAKLPKLDLSVEWTDEMLQDVFKLTDADMALVEEQVL